MPRVKARQAGLAIATDVSEEAFAGFLLEFSKRSKVGVEGVADLTRKQLSTVCGAVEHHVEKALPTAIAAADGELDDVHSAEAAILTLHGAAVLALELLTRSQQPPPEQLLNAAVLLHDGVLISNLDPELEKLQVEMQDSVMRLCCAWWERKLPGNEMLVARTIPYVLLRAIQSLQNSRTSMVHMCYVIRDALELLDFEDETIRDTKRLLLMAAMHPSFLKEPEGRRFIAGLFRLEPQMTRELCAIVRNQIPSGQRFALEAYGEILFRAWRDTVGPCAAEVESELQSLMQSAILASTPTLAAALRSVLNGLHTHKSLEKRLNPALVRLYDPILPRAFGAANAEVRRNAVHLLTAAFPIMDQEAPAAENNVRMAQQLGFLMDALTDPCPTVREAGVECCCLCLKLWWDLIPAASSAKIISDITGKLAFDSSSKVVRIAVLKGLRSLVDCQQAQPVLKKALPGLAQLLQDPDAGVREALADLLGAASSSRSLQFWDVVPPEDLLESIAADAAPGVANKISRMLVPSFFPNAQEGPFRLAALLRGKPEAGLSFCRNLVARFHPCDSRPSTSSSKEFSASVPVEQILQLAGDLASHLLATVPRAAPQQPQPPQPKRGKNVDKARGVAGKKRAKKDPPAANGTDEGSSADHQAEAGGARGQHPTVAEGQAEDDQDVVLQDATLETEDGWLAILEGLTVVVQGLGAAVVHKEECAARDVDAALSAETQAQLLKAAEEHLRSDRAIKLVLQIVAAAFFTTGAQRVRAVLFERLAQGALPGCSLSAGEDKTMELDGSHGPTAQDVGVLSEMLKTLATGSNAPKVAALLSAALGVRQPLPLRKPASKKAKAKAGEPEGHGALGRSHNEGEDDILCQGCKCAEPEDTMLLCDGCDAPCHTHCLRPALQEIPEDAWFCWECETQLQDVQLTPAAAGRCVCLLLQHEEGRQALCSHPDFCGILQAMQQVAVAEADEVIRLLQAGDADEVDSAAAAAAADDATVQEERAVLLGDPWGSLSRYCRAALHRAFFVSSPQDVAPGGRIEPASVLRTPHRTPASAKRHRRGRRATMSESGAEHQALSESAMETAGGGDASAAGEAITPLTGFFEIVPVIEFAVHACGQLTDLVLEEPSVAAQLAALQYGQGLLRFLHVVHQTELLDMTGEYVARVAHLCNNQAVLAHTVLCGLAGQGGASAQQLACISGALHVLLGLAQQMSEAVRNCAGATGPGGPWGVTPGRGLGQQGAARGRGPGCSSFSADDGDLPSEEQQQQRWQDGGESPGMAAGPGGEGAEVPLPGAALERLLVSLVGLLCDTAVEPLLKGPVRANAAALIGELLVSTKKVTHGGWLDTFCKLTGEALSGDGEVARELQEALLLQPPSSNTATAGEAAASVDEAGAAPPGPEAAGDAARVVRRRVVGGQKAAESAGSASPSHATAAKLSELLQRESPAVGVLATVLVRVCAARKAHGQLMLLLARTAGKALVCSAAQPHGSPDEEGDQPDEAAHGLVALGATALLAMCQAACLDAGAAAAQQKPRAAPGRTTKRCGALAKEAAARAALADSEAGSKAMEVLRRAVQHSHQQQVAGTSGAEDVEGTETALEARRLALQVAQVFAGEPVAGPA